MNFSSQFLSAQPQAEPNDMLALATAQNSGGTMLLGSSEVVPSSNTTCPQWPYTSVGLWKVEGWG